MPEHMQTANTAPKQGNTTPVTGKSLATQAGKSSAISLLRSSSSARTQWGIVKGSRLNVEDSPVRHPARPDHSGKRRFNTRGFVQWAWIWMVLLIQIVQGEASNPGPTIAVMNPTGLMGKAPVLAEMQADIIGVSETHLSAEGITQFKRELHFNSPGLLVSHGWPAPKRSNNIGAIGGRPRGVGFVSKYPSRAHVPSWPDEVHKEARLQVTSFNVGNQWITGGVAYGYAELPQTIPTKQATNELLAYLSEAVVHQSKGRRFIAGDWNQPLEDVELVKEWEELGWQEAQQWAQRQCNQTPIATCKRSTIRDYLFMSPELLADLERVEVQWDTCPDHAVLMAFFRDFAAKPKVPIWRRPRQVEWTQGQKECTVPSKSKDQTWSEWYQRTWQIVEENESAEQQRKGRKPLHDLQKGRGGTYEVKWVEPDTTPIRPARSGDFQTHLGGGNQQHTWITKQTRRLQHLTRLVHSGNTSPGASQQAQDLWRAIIKAQGFTGSFIGWWNKRACKLPHGPSTIGHTLPTPDHIQGLFDELVLEVRQIERIIGQQRREGATKRRELNRHLVFKDIRSEAAAPVSTLVQQIRHQVTQVAEDSKSFELQSPLQVCPRSQFSINGIPVKAEWDGAKVILESPTDLTEGQVVTQTRFVGELSEMFELFGAEWTPRWNKHQARLPETWSTLVDFAKQALPRKLTPFPPITTSLWKETLQKKKKHTATGSDGISRKDLLSIPEAATKQLIAMFEAMEQGQQWPQQLAVGLINSLEKCRQAQDTSQYRPITILPVAYRTWASIRARQSLQHIASMAPQGLLGNMPSKTTSQAWHQMQQLIEAAQWDEEEMAGCTVDLVKCFNLLPRRPLEAIAEHVGIPKGIVVAWHHYIGQLERRFVIRGSTGPPVRSVTGYPEGCPLSVVAMAITNLLCHKWLELQKPTVSIMSYVDDWQALARTAALALEAYDEIHTFCKLLDIEVDGRKSFCWSTTTSGRQTLKPTLEVKWHCRELGGHLNFTKCRTNYTVVERIQKVQPCWGRLARSSAPMAQKKQAVKQGIWPKALHGSAIVSLGKTHFDQLRTGMMRGLNVNTKGANPNLQWGLLECPTHDPEFFVVWDSVIHYRRYGNLDVMHPLLNELAQGEVKPTPGPSAVMLHRLHQLAWNWCGDGICLDQEGLPIDVYGSCKEEVKQRLRLAWQAGASSKVKHRQTFQGLPQADVDLTIANQDQFDAPERGLLRCALNGTQFTNDSIIHFGKVAHTGCQFCGEEDSQYHRHWQCRAFEPARQQVLPLVEDPPIHLPPAYYNHGWIPRSPAWWALRRELLSIPDTRATFHITDEQLQQLPEQVHIFTDGSCLHPTSRSERLATWGTCIASPDDPVTFWPLSAGGVIGWIQSVGRAEITAAISGLTFAVIHQRKLWLWVDNAEVVRRLRMPPEDLLQMTELANFDLWREVGKLLQKLGDDFLGVLKVDSHQTPDPTQEWTHSWAVRGNNTADHIAAAARATLPTSLWTQWHTLVEHQKFLVTLRDKTHKMYIDIGNQALKWYQSNSEDEEEVVVPRPEVYQAQMVWHIFDRLPLDRVEAKFRCESSEVVFRWATSLQGDGESRFVSWFQLFVDFFLNHGCSGVVCRQGKWHKQVEPAPLQNFLVSAKALARYVQLIARSQGSPITSRHRRPESNVLHFWAGCINVHWSQQRFEAVENFVLKYGRPPYRKVHQLSQLPVLG